MSVPVLNLDNHPLFPTSERRARCLLEKGEAKPYWQKGIFCIKLLKKETEKREVYLDLVLGIDTGSKREAYTVASEKAVVLNITTNTTEWVKRHVETRRNLRKSRRQRKTPYRECRPNRASLKKGRVPPSTKSRWDCKFRIINLLCRILPITCLNIEDISAKTLKSKKKWNNSFSPLEVGKKYFEEKFKRLYPSILLIKTKGYDTYLHRNSRKFIKSKKKLDYTWGTHNVDSHCLCEIALGLNIKPYFGLYRIDFLEYHRRVLHRQNPGKKGIRTEYGSTISLGLSRGAVLKYKGKFVYLGGTSKGFVSVNSIITGLRISQRVSLGDIKIMYNNKSRTQFLPALKDRVSL
jgi:hypothetical protein